MNVQLPIDTFAVSFIDVMPPEPLLDRHTKQQEADASGEPLYSIQLVCIGARGRRGRVRDVPRHSPAGIRQGMPVKVTGLMVTNWAIGDRYGLTFRATKVEPLSAADAETGRLAQQWRAARLNR
jgi:hypothetical protein